MSPRIDVNEGCASLPWPRLQRRGMIPRPSKRVSSCPVQRAKSHRTELSTTTTYAPCDHFLDGVSLKAHLGLAFRTLEKRHPAMNAGRIRICAHWFLTARGAWFWTSGACSHGLSAT